MAYVLSLQPHSPLKRSFSDNPYLSSYSPFQDMLLGSLSDITARDTSACSLYPLGSHRASKWVCGNENIPPLTSQSLLDFNPGHDSFTFGIRHVVDEPHKRNSLSVPPLPAISSTTAASPNQCSTRINQKWHVVESSSSSESLAEAVETDDCKLDESELFSFYETLRSPMPQGCSPSITGTEPHQEQNTVLAPATPNLRPFQRWLSTLRRRHVQRRKEHGMEVTRPSFDTANASAVHASTGQLLEPLRRRSESMSSSIGCVTAIKSASMTIRSTSIAPRSDGDIQGRFRLGNRSSNYSDARRSLESYRVALGPIIDESAWLRSLQRRRIIEELVSSEESYIADLKVLINVWYYQFSLYSLTQFLIRTTS